MKTFEDRFREHREQLDVLEPQEGSWERIRAQMGQPERSGKTGSLWLRVAALLVLTWAVSWYIFFPQERGIQLNELPPDIELHAPNGDVVALSELKGKVVLVQFWASWSQVCTEENCYVFRPLYEHYRDDGFEIYGISMDTARESWTASIERDRLDWIQVSDLKGWQSPVTRQCNVRELPTNFLLDRNHKVIATDLNAEELHHKLDELLVSQ